MEPTNNANNTTPTSPRSTEIDNYKDKIHRQDLKIKSLESKLGTEIDYYKDEIESHVKAIEQDKKIKKELASQIKALNAKCDELNEDLLEKISESEKLKIDLERQMKLNLKSDSYPIELPSSPKEIEVYKAHNAELKSKIKNLESTVMNQVAVLSSQEAQIKTLLSENENLKENLESKTLFIAELNDKIKAQEEMYCENKNAAMQSTISDFDDKRRGNSLFSELDSRRVKVEEELQRLRDKVKTLTIDNVNLQTKLGKGDHKSSVILTQLQAVQKSQDNVHSEIAKWKMESTRVVEHYAHRVEKLREEYQTKLLKYSNNVDPGDKKLSDERDQLLLQNISLNKQILELKRDIKIHQYLKVEADASQIIKSVRGNDVHVEGDVSSTNHTTVPKNHVMTADPNKNCQQQ